MKPALRHLLAFLAWNLAISAFVLHAPGPVAFPAILLLSAGMLWGYVLAPEAGSRARRRATLRLRPLRGETLRWTLLATPVLLLLSWAVQDVYVRLVPVPEESLNPFEELMGTPGGRAAVAVLAIGVAPVLEEFVFRGLIQRTLERRWGTVAGIAGAAALFAGVHVLPWIFPLHFFLGLAFGFAVYAARSVWAGVVLHAANNAVAMLGLLLAEEAPAARPTVWDVGVRELGLDPAWWSALFLLLVAGALAARVGRRLWEAGHEVRLRYARAEA